MIKFACKLTDQKEPIYNKKIKNVSQKRENFQIAFNILENNGYKKEISGISSEDFEKNEQGWKKIIKKKKKKEIKKNK